MSNILFDKARLMLYIVGVMSEAAKGERTMSETKHAPARPTYTASGEVIYGETPEDGIVAKVYGDPELADLMARAVNTHDKLIADKEQLIATCKKAATAIQCVDPISALKILGTAVRESQPRTCSEPNCQNETTEPHGLCDRCAAEIKAENER